METEPTPFFTADTLGFLRDLGANNERPWFEANRDRYDEHVKEPALEFIEAFGPRLQEISPRFLAVAKVQGGSLFRIHRDTRFSKDKTPYKTNTGVQFRHERGKDAHAPGFYLHLEPGASFWGAGMWRPDTKVAARIRRHLADHPDRWASATTGLTLGGDSLKRAPKGFDADDPLIDELKRKDFIATGVLTDAEVTALDFPDRLHDEFRGAAGLVRFLCEAVELSF